MPDETTVAETIRRALLDELDSRVRSPEQDDFVRSIIDAVLPEAPDA